VKAPSLKAKRELWVAKALLLGYRWEASPRVGYKYLYAPDDVHMSTIYAKHDWQAAKVCLEHAGVSVVLEPQTVVASESANKRTKRKARKRRAQLRSLLRKRASDRAIAGRDKIPQHALLSSFSKIP
jgi:hypothetical protein